MPNKLMQSSKAMAIPWRLDPNLSLPGAFSRIFALKIQRSIELKWLMCGEGRVKLELDVLQMFLGLRIAFRLAGRSMDVSRSFPFLGMLA